MLFYSSKLFVALAASSMILAKGTISGVQTIQTMQPKETATVETKKETEYIATPSPTKRPSKIESISTDSVDEMVVPTPEPTPEATPTEETPSNSTSTNKASNSYSNSSRNNSTTTYNPPAQNNSDGGQESASSEEDTGIQSNANRYEGSQKQGATSGPYTDATACEVARRNVTTAGGCSSSNGQWYFSY